MQIRKLKWLLWPLTIVAFVTEIIIYHRIHYSLAALVGTAMYFIYVYVEEKEEKEMFYQCEEIEQDNRELATLCLNKLLLLDGCSDIESVNIDNKDLTLYYYSGRIVKLNVNMNSIHATLTTLLKFITTGEHFSKYYDSWEIKEDKQ